MSMPLNLRSIDDLSQPIPEVAPETQTSVTTLGVGTSPEADVFVLMPFATEFRDVWTAIEQTSTELGVSCVRADRITVPGRISQQIVEAIHAASVIVADVTGNNPNVMFELGYADALGKPIVVLNQRLADAPFDLKDWRQIEYTTTALRDLKVTLASFLDQTLVRPRQSATDQGLAASLEISQREEAPFRVDDGRSVMHRFGVRNPGLTAARNVRVELLAVEPTPSDPSFRADFPYAVARSDSPENLAPEVTLNPGDEIRFNVGESHLAGENQAEIYMDNMTRTPEEVARHWPNHTRFDRGGRWHLRYRVTAANASPKEFVIEVSERGDKLWCRVV